MSKENENILVEVRKAYRLLYDYQDKVLDLISFIGGSVGYDYHGGYSNFSNLTPRLGKGSLGLLAWDWLNMYYYEFHFKSKMIENDRVCFSVFVLNDTGYFKAYKELKITKDDVDNYDDINNSESKLIFVVGKNLWEEWGVRWQDEEFILNKSGKKGSDDKIMVFKSYSLADFFNQDDAIKNIKDFEQYCLSYGIPFEYKEKIV
jgi:hypothetical protein